MKPLFKTLMSLFLMSVMLPSHAFVPIDGPYYEFLGGGNYTPDISSGMFTGLLPGQTNNTLKFKGGFDSGAAYGYKMGSFRIEAEGLWIQSRHRTLGGASIGGTTVMLAGFGNVLYDFDFIDTHDTNEYIPYLGLGVGYAHMRTHFTKTIPEIVVTDNETAYQLILGIGYSPDSVTTFAIDYRYVATSSLATVAEPYHAHTINLRLVHYMD